MNPNLKREQKAQLPLFTEGKLAVTKISAATNQLETAITLWFFDGDPVSICTLYSAASAILRALNKRQNGKPMLVEHLYDAIVPEYREQIINSMRDEVNFLKHADRDPDATSFLTVRNHHLHLFDAVQTYNQLGAPQRPLFRTFNLWFTVSYPELFPTREAGDLGLKLKPLANDGKAAFFNLVLPAVTRDLGGASQRR
jgi:hypothetical protein